MNFEVGLPGSVERVIATGQRKAERGPSRRALRLRLYLSLVTLDSLCLVIAFVVAALSYRVAREDQSLQIATALLPAYLLAAFGARAYSVEVIEYVTRGIARAIRSLVVAGVGTGMMP